MRSASAEALIRVALLVLTTTNVTVRKWLLPACWHTKPLCGASSCRGELAVLANSLVVCKYS